VAAFRGDGFGVRKLACALRRGSLLPRPPIGTKSRISTLPQVVRRGLSQPQPRPRAHDHVNVDAHVLVDVVGFYLYVVSIRLSSLRLAPLFNLPGILRFGGATRPTATCTGGASLQFVNFLAYGLAHTFVTPPISKEVFVGFDRPAPVAALSQEITQIVVCLGVI
jgi:hypothetical protein